MRLAYALAPLATLLTALASLAPPVTAQTVPVSQGVTLLGRYTGHGGGTTEVWGYVGPGGREYAVVAMRNAGLVVLDVTDGVPVEVSFLPAGIDRTQDVEIYGHYAYVVDEHGPVRIVDLSDPTHAVQVAVLLEGGTDGVHTLAIAGDRLYLSGGRDVGGLRVYSLADPVAPVLLGRYEPHYVHDIGVQGTTVFAAAPYSVGIDVIDASDPAHMTSVAQFTAPGMATHNVCFSEDGTHAYVGDEIGTGPWTRAFDIRDLGNVELTSELVVDSSAISHNCEVRGDRLFMAHYSLGLQVFDVSDPAVPVRVAYYDTYLPDDSPIDIYNGARGVYPHLPSGKILVTDYETGFYVFQLDEDVASEPETEAEIALALEVAPNPAAGQTRLSFTLAEPAVVRLEVFDALGRRVATLLGGQVGAGEQRLALDASSLAPGVYVVRAVVGADVSSLRLVVSR